MFIFDYFARNPRAIYNFYFLSKKNINYLHIFFFSFKSFWEIREVVVPKGSTINLLISKSDKKVILYSHRVCFMFLFSFKIKK